MQSNPLGTLPAKAARMWEYTYESSLERGLDQSGAAASAWCAVKRQYYKKGDRWLKRKKPLTRGESPPGCAPFRAANPKNTVASRRRPGKAAQAACVIGKRSHGRKSAKASCGRNAPTKKQAAKYLGRKGGKASGKARRANPWTEQVPGGLASGRQPSDFDARALAQGALVETEHTNDFLMAVEIAMDHLAEDPDYYEKLATIERHRLKAKLLR